MNDQPTACKRTYIWHWKPENNELNQYQTMNDFRASVPDFKPDDGTTVFKGRKLALKTVERVVLV